MSIKIIRSGLLTTIQDLGRYGFQKYGVIVSGAMDSFALRIANLLVGNGEEDAALEMTLIGPSISFQRDCLIAICGADLSPTMNGIPVPQWRPVYLKKGSFLDFGQCMKGCRSYLALAGGINVPKVLGSQSTYLRANMGGFEGRSLREGDTLKIGGLSREAISQIKKLSFLEDHYPFRAPKWTISKTILPAYKINPTVRVMRGKQFDSFTLQSREDFFQKEFRVTPQSDRMGYRLEGPILKMSQKLELISEAVCSGTIQVPAAGKPIVLLADRQTTGGYPKIAQLATVDLPIMAQIKPGDKIRFREISLKDAQDLYLAREKEISCLKQIIPYR